MQGKIKINIQKEAEPFAIEHALCLAHQGYKELAIFALGMLALGLGWHYNTLVYYFKEGNINQDNSEDEWMKRRSNN